MYSQYWFLGLELFLQNRWNIAKVYGINWENISGSNNN